MSVSQCPTTNTPAAPHYISSRPLPSETTPLPCSSHSSIRLVRTMSAYSFFKIPSYDSSSNEDEVQQHLSSEEASREYMDSDLIPDWSSDTEEDEEDDEPEDNDIDE